MMSQMPHVLISTPPALFFHQKSVLNYRMESKTYDAVHAPLHDHRFYGFTMTRYSPLIHTEKNWFTEFFEKAFDPLKFQMGF